MEIFEFFYAVYAAFAFRLPRKAPSSEGIKHDEFERAVHDCILWLH